VIAPGARWVGDFIEADLHARAGNSPSRHIEPKTGSSVTNDERFYLTYVIEISVLFSSGTISALTLVPDDEEPRWQARTDR
jgi:hypothetical protein